MVAMVIRSSAIGGPINGYPAKAGLHCGAALRRKLHSADEVRLCWVSHRRAVFELKLIEAVVQATCGEQFLMGARFAQLTFVQDEDAVHILNRRQAMRDGDRRAAAHHDLEGVAN